MAQSSVATNGVAQTTHPVDQVLPWNQLLIYGLQHVLAMYAGAVAVPLILSFAIGLKQEQLIYLIAVNWSAGGNPSAPDYGNVAFIALARYAPPVA